MATKSRKRLVRPRRFIAGNTQSTQQDSTEVKRISSPHARPELSTGKPRPVVMGSMRSKMANIGGGSAGGGGYGGPGSGNHGGGGSGLGVNGVAHGSGGNFYSPELSTDFLELPQSLDEQRNYFRFFYRAEPFIGQAIDLHTELPLSKIRLARPEANDKAIARMAYDFCEDWADRMGLLHLLQQGLHEWNLIGETFWFCEDSNPEMPDDVRYIKHNILHEDGTLEEKSETREDADGRAAEWMRTNYKGWTAIRILPPEQVHVESFPFSDEPLLELIPDSKTKGIIELAETNDQRAKQIVDTFPIEVTEAVLAGTNVPLNVDPMAGSFCYYMANKKSQYEPRGHSRLERCIRTIVYKDKLRQAQTSISSRHMTPIRLVYAENMSEVDTESLRDQIDLALMDPDYSIVTNFQVNWEEMTPNGRLLELTGEYDLINRELYAGLGVTESLLSGESSYSGDRINLEVINLRYMLMREMLQNFIDMHIFKPMCARMGFVELDEWGNEKVIFPRLSFTRLALRENQDVFDAAFNLYSKGSLPVSVIYDLLNIDEETATEELERDFGTFKDATYNEMLRSAYSSVGTKVGENTNLPEIISGRLHLKYDEPKEEGMGRFASKKESPDNTSGLDLRDMPGSVLDKLATVLAEKIAEIAVQKASEASEPSPE